jgi:hypothetical protein
VVVGLDVDIGDLEGNQERFAAAIRTVAAPLLGAGAGAGAVGHTGTTPGGAVALLHRCIHVEVPKSLEKSPPRSL